MLRRAGSAAGLALETGDRLADLLVGLDQGAGTFHMGFGCPGRDGWNMAANSCQR